jgi:hypothetical protein
MIALEKTLLSEDLFDQFFACDLARCKGACCVEGDSGAPLEEAERAALDRVYESVKPFLRPEGIAAIEAQGRYVRDADGEWVTPLVEGRECAYTTFDANGTAKCGLEQAHRAGATDWIKPISCHLYPIRTRTLGEYEALNYHRWPICDGARDCGLANQVSILEFCRTALVRKFGEEWYQMALEAREVWKEQFGGGR